MCTEQTAGHSCLPLLFCSVDMVKAVDSHSVGIQRIGPFSDTACLVCNSLQHQGSHMDFFHLLF